MMDYDAENDVYTATVNVLANNSFGFTTVLAENDDQGAWDYIEPYRFGPESNGDFWLQDDYIGVPLTMTYDVYGAIRVLEDGEYIVTVNLTGMTVTIEKVAPAVIKGDVNNDGVVNPTDATTLINALLNEDFSAINFANSDMDENGEVNVTDAIQLINYLLTL